MPLDTLTLTLSLSLTLTLTLTLILTLTLTLTRLDEGIGSWSGVLCIAEEQAR